MPREDLIAALSMGPVPQQAMASWRRQKMAEELAKQAAFDPALFGAGGQEMELAQGVTDPNAKFQGGGASGTWQEPPSTLGEWWEQSTAFRPMVETAEAATAAPMEVYRGELDPAGDEATERMFDLATMATLGAGAIPAKGAELGMGIRAFHGSPRRDLTTISSNPPSRQWDNATSRLGAFFSPKRTETERYAGEKGHVYSAEVVDNPYEMPWSEFSYFQNITRNADGTPAANWTARQQELNLEAEALRARLEQEGYDGIFVRGGKNNDIKEIASFRDIPVTGEAANAL